MTNYKKKREETKMSILEKVYNRTIECALNEVNTGCEMDVWQWEQGVALYGLGRAYEKTKDIKIKDFIKYWIDYHLDERTFGYSINTTAPLLGIMKLLEEDMKRYAHLLPNGVCVKNQDVTEVLLSIHVPKINMIIRFGQIPYLWDVYSL